MNPIISQPVFVFPLAIKKLEKFVIFYIHTYHPNNITMFEMYDSTYEINKIFILYHHSYGIDFLYGSAYNLVITKLKGENP